MILERVIYPASYCDERGKSCTDCDRHCEWKLEQEKEKCKRVVQAEIDKGDL